jgi:BppU N-terminal domain
MSTLPHGRIRIKEGDTRPLHAVLKADGKIMPLTGATVLFNMKPRLVGQGSTVTDGPVEITDEAAGAVLYRWQPQDVDTPGLHRGEFEVTFGDGTVETFPNGDWLDIEILADLD